MEKFGVDGIFTPENPVFSAARRRGDQHRPHSGGADRGDARERHAAGLRARGQPGAQALVRLQRRAGAAAPSSTCRWSRRSRPTTSRSRQLNRQIGAVLPRQSMKDASGASQMDPKTQVTSLHGVSMLDAAQYPLEANVAPGAAARAGRRERPRAGQRGGRRRRQPARHPGAGGGAGGARGRQRAEHRAGGGGQPGRPAPGGAARGRRAAADRAASPRPGLQGRAGRGGFDFAARPRDDRGPGRPVRRRAAGRRRPRPCWRALRGARRTLGLRRASCEGLGGHPTADAVLAAITATLAWGPLMRKRISRLTAESLPWWMRCSAR